MIEVLHRLIKMRATGHILFWMHYVLTIVLVPYSLRDPEDAWFFNPVYVALNMALVYANLFLVDRLLFNGRIFLYGVAFVALLLVFSIPIYFWDNLFFDHRWIAVFFNSIWLVLATLGFKILRKTLQVADEFRQLEVRTLNSELALLRNQISPHFLFNTLNNVYSMNRSDPEESNKMILRMADLLRYLQHLSVAPVNPLVKELRFVADYLALEKIRIKKEIDIRFSAQGDLRTCVPSFFLVPLIENAVKHGVNTLAEQLYIHIHLRVESEQVYFYVENNKSPNASSHHRAGTGLDNLQRRLELTLQAHHFEVVETTNSFAVNLSFKPHSVRRPPHFVRFFERIVSNRELKGSLF